MTSPLVLRDRIDSFPTDQVAGYNVRPGRTFPFVWLVPALALAIGAWLSISHYLDRSATIIISFHTAEGLQAGETKIKYKDIDISQILRQAETISV